MKSKARCKVYFVTPPKLAAGLFLLLLLMCSAFSALALGDAVYTGTWRLADNLEYVNTVSWSSEAGRTESFSIRMDGAGDAYPIVMNGDTIFGGFTISEMVSYAEEQGKNVLAVVNSDFFTQNAVPIGIVVEEGVYKSSPGGRNAVVFGEDGSVHILETPTVWISLSNEGSEDSDANKGNTINMRNFNKPRTETGGLVLYSEAFSTVSTRAASPGWYVRFKILEGVPSVSGTMTLEVTETEKTEGAVPIGEGYLILTAADQSNIDSEFEKFAVGDIVTLTTTTTDERLAQAHYATGGGDILILDGEITDTDNWATSHAQRAPRTVFGVKEDGTVISYVIDGRNAEHSVGMSLTELAEEMMRQGCVYAVNFDGGGSTALSVRIPGQEETVLVSRPSDGRERVSSTYMLFVTDAEPDGVAANISLQNNGVIVLAESSVDLIFSTTDSGYMPVEPPDDVVAMVANADSEDTGASINGTVFTAGNATGPSRIAMNSASAGISGIGEIYTITEPTSIATVRKDSNQPLTSLRIAPGAIVEFGITATYYRRNVIAQPVSFTYTISGDIGEMIEPGVFRGGLIANRTGTITVSIGERSAVIQVEISGFDDMTNHWAREFAEYLLQAGVVRGITETEYGPSHQMKRGDFILMLHRAAGEPETSVFSSFDDVPPEMYYMQALTWANRAGIAESVDGNNFYPEQPLTRQDAFTFTYRALSILGKEYSDGTIDDLAIFPDADLIESYAILPIATLTKLGVIEGANGMLLPRSTLTRAEMAKILAVVLRM